MAGDDKHTTWSLRLCTWNCSGLMTNVHFLEKCLKKSDICVIQEHWLYPDSLNFLSSINKDFAGWGRSSTELNMDSVWRRGKGGVAVLWRKELNARINILEELGNDRIIVAQVRLSPTVCMFILSVYLPSSNTSITKYRECLEVLDDVVDNLYEKGIIVLAGDFNGHIGKYGGPRSFDTSNRQGLALVDKLKFWNLRSVNSQTFTTGPVETYFAQQGEQLTTTDHIFMKVDELHHVRYCYVDKDQSDNLSFHLPICFCLTFPVKWIKPFPNNTKCRVSWKKIQNPYVLKTYQTLVSKKLSCFNSYTMAGEQDIEYVLSGITQILSSSAKEILPCKRNRSILRPYWNNDLKNVRTKSRECRRKWITEGRPRNSDNAAFREYKAAKCEFRKLLRRKCFEHERNEFSNMDEFYDKDRSRFQKEISAKQKSYSGVCNELKIDGRLITEKEELLSVWKDHYEQLYTPKESPVYDKKFKLFVEQQLKEYVDLSANVTNDVLETPFTTEEVSNLCSKLPNNKVGGMDELVYEHVKYAGKQFFVVLTDVYNAIRALEAIPESVEIGVIYSLFKGKKKNKLDKDNYRGITLLNVIGKILERLILDRMMPILIKNGVPDKMQFAYQKGKSCVQASFILQEAIHHAVERESKVYACFLDISKAFDCVWLDGLFFKLFNLGIQGKTWRLLKKWYSNLSCCVAHNDLLSEPFLIRQGIRQGGVISPWLFLCFNNDINYELSTMNVGINIDSLISVKSVLIADDVALLSLSVNGLQKMISTMEAYSKRWRFDYNVTKTNIITFGEHVNTHRRNVQQRCWTLYGKQIKEKLSSEHAGIRLSGNFSSTERTLEMARKGKAVVSSLMSAGVRPAGLNPICGIDIWKTVGLPTMLFGGELWSNITKTEYDILERVNRFAAKRAQGLAPSTRSEAALRSLGLWTIEGHIDKVQLMFLHKLLSLKPTNVDKIIFVVRLSSFFNSVTEKKMGFIPNIVRILNKYGLGDYLTNYIQTGDVPTKSSWKSLVKASIHQFQIQCWRQGLHIKPELGYFRDVHTELQPLELWNTAKRNPMYLKPIATLVNLLCGNIPLKLSDVVEDQGEQKTCRICHGPILGTLKHFIMDCQGLSTERELLWDNLQDKLSLNICASIFNQDDNSMLASFLSGSLPRSVSDSERDQIIMICSNGIVAMFLKIQQFLNSIVHS